MDTMVPAVNVLMLIVKLKTRQSIVFLVITNWFLTSRMRKQFSIYEISRRLDYRSMKALITGTATLHIEEFTTFYVGLML